MVKKLLWWSGLGAAFGAALGASAEDLQVQENLRIDEIRIIGKAEDALRMSGSAYVIDREELEKFEFTDIHRIVRQAPGVYFQEEEGLGLRPNIGIRGSGSGRSSRVTLMEDGIPIAPAPYSNPAAYYFPSAGRMAGVEVLKGPQVLEHGPFTVGGAVNLLSTPIPDTPSGMVNVEGAEHGERRSHAWYGATQGQWGYLIEAHRHGSEGFKDIDRSSRNTGFDKEDYVGKLRWRSAPGAAVQQQVLLKMEYAEERSNSSYLGLTDRDFKRDSTRRYGLSELDQMNNRWYGTSLRYSLEFSEQLALRAIAYRNEFKRNWFKLDSIDGDSPFAVIQEANQGDTNAQGILDGSVDVAGVEVKNNAREYESQGIQLEFTGEFLTGALRHHWTLGGRLHEDEMDRFQPVEILDQVNGSLVRNGVVAPSGSNNRFEEGEALALWLLNSTEVGRAEITATVRFEDITTRRTQFGDPGRTAVTGQRSNDTDEVMGGLGATFDLTDNWLLLAGVHQGFAPAGGGAQDGTEPEKSVNYELGTRYRGERFGLDLIGFFSDFENTVNNCSVATPCSGGRDFGTESLGESEIRGLEVAFNGDLLRQGALQVPFQLSYTYTDAEITRDADDGSVLKGDVLQYLPENVLTARVGAITGPWSVWLAASYTDEMCHDNTCDRSGVDDRFLKSEDYWTVDLSATYAINEDVSVYARVDNLFDEEAIVSRSPHGARVNKPQTGLVGMRINF